ncbi:MAG TPA: hypothetical protein VJ972_04810 [Anaerolineales bacterium]|nr:hypothetical protein [Anaerolineales bacterium]
MTSKSKPNKWADIQLTIAAIAITAVLALWNMFAGPDKEKAAEKAAEQAAQIPPVIVTQEPIVVSTMPPLGSVTLFGGEAPKPQVIVVQNKGNGGGGGGGGSVTSTSSS